MLAEDTSALSSHTTPSVAGRGARGSKQAKPTRTSTQTPAVSGKFNTVPPKRTQIGKSMRNSDGEGVNAATNALKLSETHRDSPPIGDAPEGYDPEENGEKRLLSAGEEIL